MNPTSKTIAKNATILMAPQLGTRVLTLALPIFLPRYLGAINVGKLTLANSIWAIVAIVATFGMDTLLTKEIARKPTQAARLFGASIGLRVILFLLGVLAYLNVAHYLVETIYVVVIGAFASFAWLMIGACQAVLQGLERMTPMAIATIIGKALNTIVCIAFLLMGYGVYVAAIIAVIAALVNLAIQLAALKKLGHLDITFDPRALREMFRAGVPYLMSGVFLVAYGQVDVIIISLLVNEQTVGWYGAASQLFGTSFFVPTVFITAVFPALARMYTNASDALPRVMQKSFDFLLIVAAPIGLGLFVIADPLVAFLFGAEFLPSGTLLALLGLVLIATYQNILIGQFLISTDRQNRWTIVMAVATLATIPLDLIFVPWCQVLFANGAIDGALSFVVTEIGMMLLPRDALTRANAWLAVRALIAGFGKRTMIARGAELKNVLEQLAPQFDHILLDIPAITLTSDAIALTSLIGVMLLPGTPSPAAIGWVLYALALIAIMYQPRYGIYLMLFLSLYGDILIAPWYPVHKNFSSLDFFTGPIFKPLMLYAGFIVFGLLYGLGRRGNVNIALWEARPIFYLFVFVILASNLLRKREHLSHAF